MNDSVVSSNTVIAEIRQLLLIRLGAIHNAAYMIFTNEINFQNMSKFFCIITSQPVQPKASGPTNLNW